MARLIPDDLWAILTIWQESRGESYEGKVAVAEVIRNRTMKHYSSNGTVASTVLRALQFSGWDSSDPNRVASAHIDDSDPVVQDCQRAWDDALAGSNLVKGAVLYCNPSILKTVPNWTLPSASSLVATIGYHQFYVPKEVTRPERI